MATADDGNAPASVLCPECGDSCSPMHYTHNGICGMDVGPYLCKCGWMQPEEEQPAQPQPPAEPPMVIRDDVGREIRIGMRVGCRNAGEPCDRSVRGLTLVGYEPGTDRPYVTNAGRFAVALLDHQPHMERWAAENVRSGGHPPPPAEPPAEAVPISAARAKAAIAYGVVKMRQANLAHEAMHDQTNAEPPAELVRVVLRGVERGGNDDCVVVDLVGNERVLVGRSVARAIRSLLPAGWPRDQLGQAKAPLLKLRPDMNSNECRRALSEAFGKIPEPKGGWRGRDGVIVETIRGLCTMFAPYDNPDSSGWWEIQDALAAVAQLADEVEVGL